MMKATLIIALLLCFYAATAQKKIQYQTSIEAGLLEGQQGSAIQIHLSPGIKMNTWNVGMGVGLDYYDVRSIPVYLNLQKSVFSKDRSPFLYLKGGYHFPWVKNADNDRNWWQQKETMGGLYYNGGIGYQLPALKGGSLFFAAGYSYKFYAEETSQQVVCITQPCPEYKERFEYKLRRVSLTTGLRF